MRLKDTGLTAQDIKDKVNKYMIETYERFDFLAETAKDMYLYDENKTPYLDFYAGIAVNNAGSCNEKVVAAVKDQVSDIMHTFNYPYTIPQALLAEKVCTTIGMDKIFYQNSGTEANEAMIKMARKYGVEKYGPNRYHIVTAKDGFHGRTFGAMSATGQPGNGCQVGFGPMTYGFSYAPYNDLQAFKDACTENTIAIMVEPVQGEGGAPRQAVAPAAHTVGGDQAAFQAPCDHDGEHPHGLPQPPAHRAAPGIPPQPALRLRHCPQPPGKLRHEPQRHAQQQRQRRDDPPEQIHHLVGGDHVRDAHEPQHHGGQQHAGGTAVKDTLQRQRIAGGKIRQDGGALMDKGRVHQRRHDHHGDDPPQIAPQRPAAPQPGRVPHRPDQGEHQAHRVHQTHGKGDDHGEIEEIHRRMAVIKRIAHSPHLLPKQICAHAYRLDYIRPSTACQSRSPSGRFFQPSNSAPLRHFPIRPAFSFHAPGILCAK